ncbi:VanW family protein [Anaerosporobacter sp.]|uniref:VanW family protein n=1 Tax=Anaerosporobacter sp. TaxID=1872529 RepID=UPI00286EC842|nr:VanW family protein [Anaerosporobacter sp.]
MKKKKITLIAISVLVLIAAVLTGAYVTISASIDNNTICKGIFINSVDVGGMTMEEAQDAVDSYIADRASKKVTIQVDNESVSSTLQQLGYQVNESDVVAEAMQIGKSGNIIKRYKEIKDIEKENKTFELDFTMSQSSIRSLIEEECTKYDVPAENATMKRENGAFVISEHVVGRKIDVNATVQAINDAIMNDWDGQDIIVTASVEEDVPEYTADDLRACTDVLGSATTNFADSKAARVNNVTVATSHVNGSVVYPGETFSVYESISPIEISNGYMKAGAYENGLVIESVGGGVCQVSSTLYNSVLKAELEVVERSPHSMVVSYVKPSADAAIAGTYKDLKFKNNTDSPIYIEGYIVGRNVTFTIYGKETRPSNRTIEYVSQVIETTQPPEDVITVDKTQPSSYYKVTSPSHTGYKAQLWKVIYIDGVESERIQINSSSYNASPRYITVGKEEEVKEPEEVPNDDTDEDTNADGKIDSDKGKNTDTDKSTDKDKDTDKDKNKDKDKDKGKTETDKPAKDNTTDKQDDTTPEDSGSSDDGEE